MAKDGEKWWPHYRPLASGRQALFPMGTPRHTHPEGVACGLQRIPNWFVWDKIIQKEERMQYSQKQWWLAGVVGGLLISVPSTVVVVEAETITRIQRPRLKQRLLLPLNQRRRPQQPRPSLRSHHRMPRQFSRSDNPGLRIRPFLEFKGFSTR